eukprot:TRINITY_DN34130_c0_g1_i1.p1 TRINITY_DN34130_c0_g1~~TRINITY_DN34130_c0_g1_i1.p1  ORF type:complete len:596 (+),score=123.20 TRINITY_DN34130_c0_g1_i1:267-1790(+)
MLGPIVILVDKYHISIEGVCSDEIEVMACVLDRLVRIESLHSETNTISKEEFDELDHDSKAVLTQLMEMRLEDSSSDASRKKSIDKMKKVSSIMTAKEVDLNSWDFNSLNLDHNELFQAVLYIYFDSEFGMQAGHRWTDFCTFSTFHKAVFAQYRDLPYHCYAHAVDVLHVVYRLQCITQTHAWLSHMEQYGLLIAALGHDLGHFGKTNPFLVETRDDLAMRYNDKSPLENMHCARLFSIIATKGCDIFFKASREEFVLGRKVCIEAILHTDNAHHFDTVKEVLKLYEATSDLCEMQASAAAMDPKYLDEVLLKHKMKWIQVLMHLGDIANPLRPWSICAAWAERVLDEFFLQGDEEKRLGIPLGMLNDREKVSRPGSQHGFISFLVAPFAIGVVRIFPNLHPLTSNLVTNIKKWLDRWVEAASPGIEDIKKREADIERLAQNAKELEDRHKSAFFRRAGSRKTRNVNMNLMHSISSKEPVHSTSTTTSSHSTFSKDPMHAASSKDP